MNFLSLSDLTVAVTQHELFQHQIKGKRIRKELSNLDDYQSHNDRLTFKKYTISSSGISFFVETHIEHRFFNFEILIDCEYPFNRPKIFYLHENSSYAYCQDLLDSVLDGNWGPSMLISSIFDKLHSLAKCISEENGSLRAVYHIGDFYEEELLTNYKIQLFEVDQYEWKYMIKSTFKKVLGLTKENLLKFTSEGSKLKLQAIIKIKDLKEANASINSGKYKLDIVCNNQEPNKEKYYFGGEEADIEKILYFMNPIQVTERKLNKPQKQNYKSEQLQEIIQQYSDLIEYYSLRDPQKTKKYVGIVQDLIKKNYEKELKPEKKLEELQEDIKT